MLVTAFMMMKSKNFHLNEMYVNVDKLEYYILQIQDMLQHFYVLNILYENILVITNNTLFGSNVGNNVEIFSI